MITCCNVHRKLLVKTVPLYSVEDSAFVFSMASSLGYVPCVVHKYDGTNWSVWQEDMTEVLSYVGVVDLIVKKSPGPNQLVRTMQMNYWNGSARIDLLYVLFV